MIMNILCCGPWRGIIARFVEFTAVMGEPGFLLVLLDYLNYE